MKKTCFLFFLFLVLGMVVSSCAPVLREDLMRRGMFDVRLSEIKGTPAAYKGQLFILGGVIAETKATEQGSLIEAMYVPVNARGYLKGTITSQERFLALSPGKFLDPLMFSRGREITLAGEFTETKKGKIEEMDYDFPLFEIKELYLWEKRIDHYYREPAFPPYWYYPYPYWWYDPWWYGPRLRHYH